jgi:hypothetical protein
LNGEASLEECKRASVSDNTVLQTVTNATLQQEIEGSLGNTLIAVQKSEEVSVEADQT